MLYNINHSPFKVTLSDNILKMMRLFKKYYYSFQIDNILSPNFQDNIRAFVFLEKTLIYNNKDLSMIFISRNNKSCNIISYGSNDCVRCQAIFLNL